MADGIMTEMAQVSTGIEIAVRFSRIALAAGMLKPEKRKVNRDGVWVEEPETEDQMMARCTMILLQARELDIPEVNALQTMALINGRICIYGDAVTALLQKANFEIDFGMDGTPFADDWTAWVEITRPGSKKPVRRTFSVAQAKRAGLWQANALKSGRNGDYPNDSPWYKYPDRMLFYRALGFCARDGAADVMRGMYVREEMDDHLRLARQSMTAIQTVSRDPATQADVVEADPPDDIPDEAPAQSGAPTDDGPPEDIPD